jgi:hypothetical protein
MDILPYSTEKLKNTFTGDYRGNEKSVDRALRAGLFQLRTVRAESDGQTC